MLSRTNDYHYQKINKHGGNTYKIKESYIPRIEENYTYSMRTLETSSTNRGDGNYTSNRRGNYSFGNGYTPYKTNTFSNRSVAVINESKKRRRNAHTKNIDEEDEANCTCDLHEKNRDDECTCGELVCTCGNHHNKSSYYTNNKKCVCGNAICTCGARHSSSRKFYTSQKKTGKGYRNSTDQTVINSRVGTKLSANKVRRHFVEGLSNTSLTAVSSLSDRKKNRLSNSVASYSRRKNDDNKIIKTIESKYVSRINRLPFLYAEPPNKKRLLEDEESRRRREEELRLRREEEYRIRYENERRRFEDEDRRRADRQREKERENDRLREEQRRKEEEERRRKWEEERRLRAQEDERKRQEEE